MKTKHLKFLKRIFRNAALSFLLIMVIGFIGLMVDVKLYNFTGNTYLETMENDINILLLFILVLTFVMSMYKELTRLQNKVKELENHINNKEDDTK